MVDAPGILQTPIKLLKIINMEKQQFYMKKKDKNNKLETIQS